MDLAKREYAGIGPSVNPASSLTARRSIEKLFVQRMISTANEEGELPLRWMANDARYGCSHGPAAPPSNARDLRERIAVFFHA